MKWIFRYVTTQVVVWLAIRVASWKLTFGIPVGVVVPKGMDEDVCYERILDPFQLIDWAVPYRSSRLRRDLRRIICCGTGREAHLGGYVPLFRTCVVDPRHVLSDSASPLSIASTILHESTHARLHSVGVGSRFRTSMRVEEVCERAGRDLARKLEAYVTYLPDTQPLTE